MRKPFRGTVETDIRKSEQDWSAYTQSTPPPGSPNVVDVFWDDTGIATWDFFGGKVKMPNMKRIADKGLRFTQFHTTARCSPTRQRMATT